MEKPTQLIILGGGYSVKEGVEKGLFNKLQNKFVMGINFAYKVYNPTLTVFIDPASFYKRQINELKSLPLIVGKKHGDINDIKLANTILLDITNQYNRDCKKGVFSYSLAGVFATSLGVHLLDVGTIFLLGFNFGAKPSQGEDINHTIKNQTVALEDITNKAINKFADRNIIKRGNKNFLIKTHFYQDKFTHKGTGCAAFYYIPNKIEKYFGIFRQETKCKIYNVNPWSRIPNDIFEKISYDKFFELLDDKTYNQDELREYIKERIKLCLK